MECTFKPRLPQIVNIVIVTSLLFMFTLDNNGAGGDTDFVFFVLLLY